MKQGVKVIGLMSGTSADGINAAIVEIKGSGLSRKINLICHKRYPYSKEFSCLIHDVSAPGEGSAELICHLNFSLGQKFANAALRIVKEANLEMEQISIVGSHGQTICHIPNEIKGEKNVQNGYRTTSTLQIGEPSVIAEITGVTTVADFRPGDIAAGGEGAPLTPYAHRALFGRLGKPVVINNLGGISNLTYLPGNGAIENILAFDSGPGNMVIDSMMCLTTNFQSRYDLNGSMAKKGKINEPLLRKMMRHSFLRKHPPKSTGREEFGLDYARSILNQGGINSINTSDLMATVTLFTARSIAYSYNKFLKIIPNEAIFCGGGVKNKTLMSMIRMELNPVQVKTTDDYGIPADAVESISFAILAHAAVRGEANNVPSATGAKRNVVLGKIVHGRNRIAPF